jgi:hypothetical protein
VPWGIEFTVTLERSFLNLICYEVSFIIL